MIKKLILILLIVTNVFLYFLVFGYTYGTEGAIINSFQKYHEIYSECYDAYSSLSPEGSNKLYIFSEILSPLELEYTYYSELYLICLFITQVITSLYIYIFLFKKSKAK